MEKYKLAAPIFASQQYIFLIIHPLEFLNAFYSRPELCGLGYKPAFNSRVLIWHNWHNLLYNRKGIILIPSYSIALSVNRQLSSSLVTAIAAIVPSATAVVIWRYFLLRMSPTANTPSILVLISSSVMI